jgi:hypothetical protein
LGKNVSHWRAHAKNTTGDSMTLHDFLQFGVCVFSILAAGFWLQSASSRLAVPIAKAGRQSAGVFPQAITSQSQWNAAGAVCAGTAALSQSIAAMLPYVGLN